MFQSARAASALPIYSNGALIVMKLGVGIAIGSISVVSYAFDTGVDLLSAFVSIRAGTQRYFDITLTTCQHLTEGPLTCAQTNTGQERSLPGNARI